MTRKQPHLQKFSKYWISLLPIQQKARQRVSRWSHLIRYNIVSRHALNMTLSVKNVKYLNPIKTDLFNCFYECLREGIFFVIFVSASASPVQHKEKLLVSSEHQRMATGAIVGVKSLAKRTKNKITAVQNCQRYVVTIFTSWAVLCYYHELAATCRATTHYVLDESEL